VVRGPDLRRAGADLRRRAGRGAGDARPDRRGARPADGGRAAASGFDVNRFSNEAFWAEKRIPRWLRYGAASYCERYFLDPAATDGGNPRRAREWGLANLRNKGGLGELEDVFEFRLSLDDVERSTKLIHEAGAVVAYVLDGEDGEVAEAHAAFKAALKAGGDTAKAVAELEKALLRSGREIERFARP
jgi:hypothetical protein